MTASLDDDINLFIKISRKINFYDDNDKLDEEKIKNLLRVNDIQLKNLNNQDFDVIIYAIIDDLSSDYIKFLIREGEFKNLNYTFILTQKFKNYLDIEGNEEDEEDFNPLYQVNSKTNPLFMAISSSEFSISNVLLKKGADLNYEIRKNNDILNYLISNDCLNRYTLNYILKHGFDIRRMTSPSFINKYVSKYENDDLLRRIFKRFIFDNEFILSLLCIYKNKTSLSNQEINEIISKENNKIPFDEELYSRSIRLKRYNIINLFLDYDKRNKDIVYNIIHKYNILNISLFSKNINLIIKALHYEMPYMDDHDLRGVVVLAIRDKNVKIGLIQFFNICLKKGNMKDCQNICVMIRLTLDKQFMNDLLLSITNNALLCKCSPQFLSLLLNMAIKTNNKNYVRSLIEDSELNLDVNLRDELGDFPLFTALYNSPSNNIECDIFCYLIDHGADISIKDEEGISLLMNALEFKKYRALNYILKQPLTIDLDMNESYSPLIKAIYLNHPETVKSLLQKRNSNDPTIKRTCIRYKESPFKPLVLAYLLNRKDIFSLLIDHNSSSINFLDSNGYSILHYAILKGDNAMVKQLIAKGVDPNININEINILEMVMAIEDKALFSILVSNTNIQVNQLNRINETPLITLLKMDSKFFKDRRFKIDGVKELIRKGAKVNVTDKNGKSALAYAIEEKDKYHCYDIVELLLNNKADPNFLVKNDMPKYPRIEEFEIINERLYEYRNVIRLTHGTPVGKSPLFYAIKNNDLPLVKLLIEKGADLFQVISYAFFREGNALRYAAEIGCLEIFKYLFEISNLKMKEKGSSCSKSDEDLIGIMFCCLLSQQTEIYEYLLHKKFKDGDVFPTNLLKMILKSNNFQFIYILIQKNFIIDLSQAPNESQELLINCMNSFQMSILSYLVKNGVNPQPIIDNEFYMNILVHDFDLEFFKCLVDHGLNINYTNEQGYTFLYYAIFEGNTKMIKYLIEQGADLNARCMYGSLSDVNKYFNKSGSLYDNIQELLNSCNH